MYNSQSLNNAQTFSQSSEQYAKHRPQYPDELFLYLSELCKEHHRVWDCATGNGQAAVSCAKYFSHIEATDISEEQIKNAIQHSKIKYSVSPAEQTSFENESFNLVTVAVAIHWFDQKKFFQEVNRVLKPNGILAIWSYGLFEIESEIDKAILEELLKPIDPFWAEGNRQVMNGYRDLVLPFDEIQNKPSFVMKIEWNLSQLLAYLRTWSAVKRYMTEIGTDPVEALEKNLKPIWQEPNETKNVKMPLFLRVSRK